jgi:hypothetical protein
VAVESIQELEKQKREIPEAYRFIVLDEEYEALQEKCKEETLTYYGEVESEQQPDDQQSDLSRDGSSNRPNNQNITHSNTDNPDNQQPDFDVDSSSNPNKDNTDF